MRKLNTTDRYREARFETFEARQMMSATPLSDFALEDEAEVYQGGALDPVAQGAYDFTGLSSVRSRFGLSGAGQTVVVIDSGIAYDHEGLGGGIGRNYRVVGGWDFAENDANPYDDGLGGSHGTHVAGIVGADGAFPGVASDVDLVALRVFNDAGGGNFAWVEQALQWVHANRNSFANPITTINLSLGSSWNSSAPPNWAMLEDEFAQLKTDGIFISVAAGNSFTSYKTAGLSYPAASSHVVPVASVGASGNLSGFSQRDSRVIAAPGERVMSTIPDYMGNNNGLADDYATMSGTSMAAPYVAGASVLIRQAMQMAGYQTVNQDLIYNVMRSTADSVYDSVTNQSYLRLNVEKAIDSILSADDYGSTADTAHNLGAIATTGSIAGKLHTAADVDYFRFTAGQSGTMTIVATPQDAMTTRWQLATGAATGNTITMQVVAGQTYTLGVGSAAGAGEYSLNFAITRSVTQLGSVDFRALTDQNLGGGETWYGFTASRSGVFTVEALFAHAGGNVDLELYNANNQLVASSATTGNTERIDVSASAGQSFTLRVRGANSDVDLRLTNLVSRDGAMVYVAGTAAADTFDYTGGFTQRVTINGVGYEFSSAITSAIVFDGGAGADTATLNGTAGDDQVVMRSQTASLTGAGYAVAVSGVETVTVAGLGGFDSADLYDSAGNDTLVADFTSVRLSGAGFSNTVTGFESVVARGSTGVDVANFADSAGADTYVARPTEARMSGAGYNNFATGFDEFHATSSRGGADVASFFDSAGADTFMASPLAAQMYGSGYLSTATGFKTIYAYAQYGGVDAAYLTDSAGDDFFQATSWSASMGGSGWTNYVVGFEVVSATATGGFDTAFVNESARTGIVTNPGRVVSSGVGFYNIANAFDKLIAPAPTNPGGGFGSGSPLGGGISVRPSTPAIAPASPSSNGNRDGSTTTTATTTATAPTTVDASATPGQSAASRGVDILPTNVELASISLATAEAQWANVTPVDSVFDLIGRVRGRTP